MGLPYYQMSERAIAVLFLMADGDEHALLDKEEFFRQCNALKIFEMTKEQFQRFKHEKINPVGIAKRGSIWPNKK